MDPTHGEVLDSLILLRASLLDQDTAIRLRQHLQVCSECRHEWEALQAFSNRLSGLDLGSALRDGDSPHVDVAELWRLADALSDPSTEPDQEVWRHILRCRRCFLGVVRHSETLKQEQQIDVPDSARSANAVWEALQLRRMRLLLTWSGVALQIALRTAPGRRAVRRRGGQENREVTKQVDQPWAAQKQFGAYTVGIEIVPQDTSRRVFRLSAKLDGPMPLRAGLRFWRGLEGDVRMLADGGSEFLLSDLEPDKYTLDVTEHETGEQLGCIELEFSGTSGE